MYNFFSKTQLTKNLMVCILLIFFVILGCSVTNGLFFVGYGFPENIVFMTPISLIIVVSLILYWRISRNWEKPSDEWDAGHHARPFSFMFGLSLAIAILSLLILMSSLFSTTSSLNQVEFQVLIVVLVSSISAAISYGIASIRERKYTDGLFIKT